MKINYGCGRRVTDGFFNIDAQVNPNGPRPPELLHILEFDKRGNLKQKTPLGDECADELHCYHLIEHFYAWEAPAVVSEFNRLLKRGGKLILELPDLEHACRNLLKGLGDQMSMWPLYGNPKEVDPYMCHKWGYTKSTITDLLKSSKMKKVMIKEPQTHKKRANRDMRVEAIKS